MTKTELYDRVELLFNKKSAELDKAWKLQKAEILHKYIKENIIKDFVIPKELQELADRAIEFFGGNMAYKIGMFTDNETLLEEMADYFADYSWCNIIPELSSKYQVYRASEDKLYCNKRNILSNLKAMSPKKGMEYLISLGFEITENTKPAPMLPANPVDVDFVKMLLGKDVETK